MAEKENGRAAVHRPSNKPDEREQSTLVPMLIGGLILIIVGMAAVAIFV